MVGTGALLEARRLFQTVAPVDRVRYSQARQYVAELEQEWVDQFGDELDQLLVELDPGELLRAIRDARAVLPGSGLVEVAIQSRGERALTAAADAATELVQEDLAAAERLLDAISALFISQRFEAPASFVAATELVAQEKARVEQQRIQEWQSAIREATRPAPPSPAVAPVPRAPTFQPPEPRCRADFSNPNWQEELRRCWGADFGPSPSPPRPSPVAPSLPVQPAPPVVQCPIPRARIVLTSLDVNIQHDGGLAIYATLTTSMSGYVENLSTGLVGAAVSTCRASCDHAGSA
jgi:hypothetical protein